MFWNIPIEKIFEFFSGPQLDWFDWYEIKKVLIRRGCYLFAIKYDNCNIGGDDDDDDDNDDDDDDGDVGDMMMIMMMLLILMPMMSGYHSENNHRKFVM